MSPRYDQCDDTCTVDCGHCKGQGRPAYVPKVGDRVRVVIEGQVYGRQNDDVHLTVMVSDGGYHILKRSQITSVERLPDPLPTTPGSVIRVDGNSLLALGTHGQWVSLFTSANYTSDQMPTERVVLFDAGATP